MDKARLAYEEFSPKSVVIAGGVAASSELRRQLTAALPLPIEYPDLALCTDNAAMVAALGCFKALKAQPTADPYSLASSPICRCSLLFVQHFTAQNRGDMM